MKKHFFSLRERGLFLLLLGLFLSFSSYAQDITVKGVVKDSKFGDPIIGASVLVKGTTNVRFPIWTEISRWQLRKTGL